MHLLNWILTPLLFCFNFQDRSVVHNLVARGKVAGRNVKVKPWPVYGTVDVEKERGPRNTDETAQNSELPKDEINQTETTMTTTYM